MTRYEPGRVREYMILSELARQKVCRFLGLGRLG